MSKQWKQFREGSVSGEPSVSVNESKMFGAELSQNVPSMDLHGLDTDSGVHALDLFLHAGFTHGEEVVKIIHGRGTGKMREAVQAFLSTEPIVETFRDAQNSSEISGVTYVVLKKQK